jgi:hypothetical protein
MATFVPFERDQAFLLPPDMKDWLPDDDLSHFVVGAAERATHRDFGVRFVTVNTHPDHDPSSADPPSFVETILGMQGTIYPSIRQDAAGRN